MDFSYIHELFYNHPIEIFGGNLTMLEIGFAPVLPIITMLAFYGRKRTKKKLKYRIIISLTELLIFTSILFINQKQNVNAFFFFLCFSLIELLVFVLLKIVIDKKIIEKVINYVNS